MDKNAIKKYAVWARNELIERVSQKADQYEVSADADPNADSAHGVLLTADEKKQRAALIKQVKEKGQDQVMEEVAYTWFNRFSARVCQVKCVSFFRYHKRRCVTSDCWL